MDKLQKKKNIIVLITIIAVLSLTCLFFTFINVWFTNFLHKNFKIVEKGDNLLVHFIDVGQGDAIAINLPDGKTMLIDSGNEDGNVNYTKYIKDNVLNNKTNNKIDYLILTHADFDHVGGTMKLLKCFDVKMIFMPRVESNSNSYQELLMYIQQNCKYKMVIDDYVLTNGKYKFTFLKQVNDNDTNNSSQVIKLEYMNKSFLFAGDISKTVEDDYINEYGNFLDCDVLKVSHHGSNSSTSEEFIKYISPKYSIISVGKDNSYGHPADDVIARLKNENSKIIRTDKSGDILFIVGENYNLKYSTGNYYVIGISLDYRLFILLVDFVLIIEIVIIIVKKEKVNKHIT